MCTKGQTKTLCPGKPILHPETRFATAFDPHRRAGKKGHLLNRIWITTSVAMVLKQNHLSVSWLSFSWLSAGPGYPTTAFWIGNLPKHQTRQKTDHQSNGVPTYPQMRMYYLRSWLQPGGQMEPRNSTHVVGWSSSTQAYWNLPSGHSSNVRNLSRHL